MPMTKTQSPEPPAKPIPLSAIKNEDGERFYDHVDAVLESVGPQFDCEELARAATASYEPVDPGIIEKIRSDRDYIELKAASFARCSYHNGDHWDGVASRAVDLARFQGLSETEATLLELFGMFHDISHQGVVGGEDWERNIQPSIKVTAEFCQRHRIGKAACLKLLCMIASSTSFDDKFQPENDLSRTAVMADLGSFVRGGQYFLETSLKVQGEVQEHKRPKNFAQWCHFQRVFCTDYLEPRLKLALRRRLVPVFWQDQYRRILSLFDSLLAAPDWQELDFESFQIGRPYFCGFVERVEGLLPESS